MLLTGLSASNLRQFFAHLFVLISKFLFKLVYIEIAIKILSDTNLSHFQSSDGGTSCINFFRGK